MSIKKLDSGNYFYRFSYKGVDHSEGGFRTMEQVTAAERRAKDKAINQETNPTREGHDMTFRQAGAWWLSEWAPTKRSSSVDEGRMPLMMDYFGDRLLREITPEDIDKFLRELPKLRAAKYAERKIKARPMSDHTKNHYRSLIHALYERLKRKRKYFGENPVAFVDRIEVPVAKTRFIYPLEEMALTPIIKENADLFDYYLLGVELGMRISELMGMRVKHVDFTLNNIYIPHPKNNRSRYVPFDLEWDPSHSVMRLLKRLVAGKENEAYVLPHWSYTYIKEHLALATAAAGVKDVTIHVWRHSFAFHRLSHGQPLYIVAKLMGHSSQSVTERHYGHLESNNPGTSKLHPESFLSCNRIAMATQVISQLKTQL